MTMPPKLDDNIGSDIILITRRNFARLNHPHDTEATFIRHESRLRRLPSIVVVFDQPINPPLKEIGSRTKGGDQIFIGMEGEPFR
jgi:hypothetical protein